MSADGLAYYRGALCGLKFEEGRRPSGRRCGAPRPRRARPALERRRPPPGPAVVSRNVSLTLSGPAGQSLAAVHDVLHALAARGGPTRDAAARHAQGAGARGRVSKFDPCLPPAQLARLLIDGVLDVEGARRVVGLVPSPDRGAGPERDLR